MECDAVVGVVAGRAVDDEFPTAAAAAAAYRTGRAAGTGGRGGRPFLSTLDIGCEDVDIGGGGFDEAERHVFFRTYSSHVIMRNHTFGT